MDPEIPNFKSVHDLLPNEPSHESFLNNNLPTEATDFLVYLRLEEENSSRSSEISLLPDFPNFGYDFDGQSVEYLLEFLTGNGSSLLAPVLGMSEREQLFISMLYGTAIAVALMGNLAVILVFLFGRRWDSDLSVYLANLAFSDIVLSLFCMPFTMSQVVKHHWPFSDVLCPVVMFLQLASVVSSVYTLVAVGANRYFFVRKPLEARSTKRRGGYVVGGIWVLAVGLASVQVKIFPH